MMLSTDYEGIILIGAYAMVVFAMKRILKTLNKPISCRQFLRKAVRLWMLADKNWNYLP